MKRYLLFYGDEHYPEGGMNDFVGDYDNVHEAIKAAEELDFKSQERTKASWDKQGNFTYQFVRFKGVWSHVWDTEKNSEAWSS